MNIYKALKEYKQFIIAAIFFSILGTGVTFALPYVPTDQELDPSCAPGDTDCYVSILAVGNAVTDATAGSIFFAGTSGVLQQDNANFFWDDTNNRLGVGTATPTDDISVLDNASHASIRLQTGAASTGFTFLQLYDGRASGRVFLIESGRTLGQLTFRDGTAGTERMRLTDTGNFLVGSTTDSARLMVQGSGATSATNTAAFHNSTGTNNAMIIRDDGRVIVGAASGFGSSSKLDVDGRTYTKGLWSTGVNLGFETQVVAEGTSGAYSSGYYYRFTNSNIAATTGLYTGINTFIERTSLDGSTFFVNKSVNVGNGRTTFTAGNTAIANNDYGWNFTGTMTSNSNPANNIFGVFINPTLVAGGNNQVLNSLRVQSNFTPGAFTGLTYNGARFDTVLDGSYVVEIQNTSSGSNARAQLRVGYGAGGATNIISYGSGHSTPNQGLLITDSALVNGLGLYTSTGPLTFTTAGTTRGLWDASGNLGVGLSSSVSARLHVRGSGATNATNALLLQDSSTNEMWKFSNDSALVAGSFNIFRSHPASPLSPLYNGRELVFQAPAQNNSNDLRGWYRFTAGNQTQTAGFSTLMGLDTSFVPTSGTSIFNALSIAPTINQTGGANGITRGIYINPTLTAAADFRAIETSAGKVIFNSDLASSYTASILHDGNNDNRWGLLIQAGADTPSANKWIQFNDGDGTDQGSVCYTGGQANICAPSDIRLKQNITDTTLSLSILNSIQVKDFSYISDSNNTTIHGFIAQELNEVYPNAVSIPQDPNEHWKVSYNQLTPLIVKSIQELNSNLTSLDPTKPNTLASLIKSYLGDALNGLERLFVGEINSDEINTKALCVSDESGNKTCINKSQLDAFLESQSISPAPEEPVIEETPITEEPTPEEPTPEEVLPIEESTQ